MRFVCMNVNDFAFFKVENLLQSLVQAAGGIDLQVNANKTGCPSFK